MKKKECLKIFHFDMNFVCMPEEYIRKWLRKLAEMGYNAILWELENKIAWKTCPECVWPEALSKKAFKGILDYSRKLGLEPIPLFQTIGHGEYVLLHKKYHSFRENPKRHDCYCTSKPEVRKFLKKWIKEYLELFGKIRFFHLGGDEAYEFGSCPVCKKYCDKNGRNKLYAEHIKDISKPIFDAGVRPGVWCDMILHHPGEMDFIPRDFLIWDWNYWASSGSDMALIWGKGAVYKKDITASILKKFPRIINKRTGKINPFYTSDFLKNSGYDVVLCSSSRSAGDSNYCGRHEVHADNIIGCAAKAASSGLAGTCVTSWAVRLHSLETQEQWLALASPAVANPGKSADDIMKNAGKLIFGTAAEEFFEAIELIGTPFLFTTSQQVGIQWTGLKDSLPAPKNYIRNLIEKIKSSKDERWKKRHENIETAEKNIIKGIDMLNSFASRSSRRSDILLNWSIAGQMQLWHLQAAKAVIAKAEKKNIDRDAIREMFRKLQSLYEAANADNQTPESLKLNSSLIYDALFEYLNS